MNSTSDVGPTRVSTHVVALVHGIRTQGQWAELVQDVLEADAGVMVEPIKYGYLDLFRFVCPIVTRRAAVEEVHQKLLAIREYHPGSDLSVVAHSFGTYVIASILLANPFLRVRRLIFCGSIVRRKYPWAHVAHKIAERKVVNDCGGKDIWPVLATALTFGFGPTGTFGFGDPKVRDRFHPKAHCDYFDAVFVREYWAPYIAHGMIRGTDWERTRPPAPWWMSVLSVLPVRWLMWIPVGLMVWLSLKYASAFLGQ